MKSKNRQVIWCAFMLLCPPLYVSAQIYFDGTDYSQNFDSLASSGPGHSWENNVTLEGWFVYAQPEPGTAVTSYSANSGANGNPGLYSFGAVTSVNGVEDRALGIIGQANQTIVNFWGDPIADIDEPSGWIALGLANVSGTKAETVTLRYDGEQWRVANNQDAPLLPHQLVVEYGIGESFTSVSSWTLAGEEFDFTGLLVNSGDDPDTPGAKDGNSIGRVANIGGSIDLDWQDGETLWIRWAGINNPGTEHGLGIDNVQINAELSDENSDENGFELIFNESAQTFSYTDNERTVVGILHTPDGEGPFPAIIINHGRGGSSSGFSRARADEMQDWGAVRIAADLTHMGGGSNDPTVMGYSPENIARGEVLMTILEELAYVDMDRIAVFGHSMGGFATIGHANALKERIRVAAITAAGTVSDTTDDVAAPRNFEAAEIVTPFIMFHGSNDSVVNPSFSERFKGVLDGLGVENERVIYDGLGHNLYASGDVKDDILYRTYDWFAVHGLFGDNGGGYVGPPKDPRPFFGLDNAVPLDYPIETVLGNVYLCFFPWIYTPSHGWVLVGESETRTFEDGAWFYSVEDGNWWYTSPSIYPWIYDIHLRGWMDSSGQHTNHYYPYHGLHY